MLNKNNNDVFFIDNERRIIIILTKKERYRKPNRFINLPLSEYYDSYILIMRCWNLEQTKRAFSDYSFLVGQFFLFFF